MELFSEKITWIRFKTAKPSRGMECLVMTKYGGPMYACYRKDDGFYANNDFFYADTPVEVKEVTDVTHWTPLFGMSGSEPDEDD